MKISKVPFTGHSLTFTLDLPAAEYPRGAALLVDIVLTFTLDLPAAEYPRGAALLVGAAWVGLVVVDVHPALSQTRAVQATHLRAPVTYTSHVTPVASEESNTRKSAF